MMGGCNLIYDYKLHIYTILYFYHDFRQLWLIIRQYEFFLNPQFRHVMNDLKGETATVDKKLQTMESRSTTIPLVLSFQQFFQEYTDNVPF